MKFLYCFAALFLSVTVWAGVPKQFELKVNGETLLRNMDIASAEAQESGPSNWSVMLKLKQPASEKIAAATKKNIGKKMDVVLDGQVRNSPIIHSQITNGTVLVAGGFSKEEAADIAVGLGGKAKVAPSLPLPPQ